MPTAGLLLLALAALGHAQTGEGGRESSLSSFEEHFAKADGEIRAHRYAQARRHLERSVRSLPERSPQRVIYYERLGFIALQEKKFRQAELTYFEGLKLAHSLGMRAPVVGEAYAGMGFSLAAQGQSEYAARFFQKSLEFDPSPLTRRIVERRLGTGGSLQESRVAKISFEGHRTQEEVLRRQLPFKEGDQLSSDDLRLAKESLFKMALFKGVRVSSSASAGGETEVKVAVEDGWYVIPFPFYAAGSGGGRGGLYLAARNLFRRAESFSLLGMASAKKALRGAFGAELGRFSFETYLERHEYVEREYEDRAFSAVSDLGDPPDDKNPGNYGVVVGAYRKLEKNAGASLGFPIPGAPKLDGEAGYEYGQISYVEPLGRHPADGGRQGKAYLALKAGERLNPSGAGLGAILGFGLADLEDRIRPLARPVWRAGGEARYHWAQRWTGSDFNYRYGQARANISLSWGRHQSLALLIAGGAGHRLTPFRLLSTGRSTGLEGSYARQFRGELAAGASLSYYLPFRITRRGVWQGIAFAEAARAGDLRKGESKRGFGGSLSYRFWRFPIPLGLSYTYSLDDHDGQISAAIGGRF